MLFGRMALPNEFESKLITQLRHSCKGLDSVTDWSDMFFVRWLRARNYDMKRAEKMLRENQAWRRLYKVNRILDNGLDAFFKAYPLHLGLLDKRGRPVVVLPLGSWDLKAAIRNGLGCRFKTYVIQCVEAVIKSIEIRDSVRKPCAMPVTQFTLVMDFAGFPYAQLFDAKVLRCLHHLVSTLEANYPETMANCICINCPLFLSTSLQKLMLFTRSGTRWKRKEKKVVWYGMDRDVWEEALRKVLPDDDLQTCMWLIMDKENSQF